MPKYACTRYNNRSTLDGMLMQQNRDINTIQTYIHSLQSKQTERILLVNTHHAALDRRRNCGEVHTKRTH